MIGVKMKNSKIPLKINFKQFVTFILISEYQSIPYTVVIVLVPEFRVICGLI